MEEVGRELGRELSLLIHPDEKVVTLIKEDIEVSVCQFGDQYKYLTNNFSGIATDPLEALRLGYRLEKKLQLGNKRLNQSFSSI